MGWDGGGVLRTIADAPGSALPPPPPPPPPPGTPTPARLSRSGLGRLRTAHAASLGRPGPPAPIPASRRPPSSGSAAPGVPQPADTHIISVSATDALHDHRRRRQLSAPPPQPPPPRLLPRRRRRRALCPPPEQRGRGIACGAHRRRRRRASCGRCLDSGTGPTPRGGREGGGELPAGPGCGPRLPSRASGKRGARALPPGAP